MWLDKLLRRTPWDDALALAQKRAALPVSEGGLGLPPDNTAMDRAAVMFPLERYHGTSGEINPGAPIDAFSLEHGSPGLYGTGIYSTSSPIIAGGGKGNTIAPYGYATNEKLSRQIEKESELAKELSSVESTLQSGTEHKDIFIKWRDELLNELRKPAPETGGGVVYPLRVSNENPFIADKAKLKRSELPPDVVKLIEDSAHNQGKNPKGRWPLSYDTLVSFLGDNDSRVPEILKAAGYTGIRHTGGVITGVPVKHTVDVSWDPSNIRSRFAAFDPFRRHESDLLAGVAAPLAAGAVGLGALASSNDADASFAGALARTADKGMLKLAEEAEQRGLPMDRIRDATGWFKGVDGKWRFEVDDSAARFNVTPATGLETGIPAGYGGLDVGPTFAEKNALIAHPELARAYDPREVAPSTFIRDSGTLLNTERGAFDPTAKSVTLYAPMDASGGKSTALHEIQHAIQTREGFARGGSPAALDVSDEETARLATQLRATQQRYAQAMATGQDPYDIESSVDAIKVELERAKQEWDSHKKLMQAVRKGGAFEAYRRLAGEVESRNVQARLGLSADDRRMLPPWLTEDVPRNQQIVRMDSANGMSWAAEQDAKRKRLMMQLSAEPRPPTFGDQVRAFAYDMATDPGTYVFGLDSAYAGEGSDIPGAGMQWDPMQQRWVSNRAPRYATGGRF